jgi:hypothetical protein
MQPRADGIERPAVRGAFSTPNLVLHETIDRFDVRIGQGDSTSRCKATRPSGLDHQKGIR